MKHATNVCSQLVVIGLDLGDRVSHFVGLNAARKVIVVDRVLTMPDTMRKAFSIGRRVKVIVETGSHAPWVVRLLREIGHEVVLANSRRLALITQGAKKSDRTDAEHLARLGMADETLLSPVHVRSEQTLQDRALLTARDALVNARTKLITTVRGVVKPHGLRIRSCSTEAFPSVVSEILPQELKCVLSDMLDSITVLTKAIDKYDEAIERVAKLRYPVTEKLRQVPGVGPITSLAFVLAIENPARFRKSRDVGSYLGLAPRLHESSSDKPQTSITKAGDGMVRRLLVNSVHYMLGRFGPACDLKSFGEALCERGGKNAKKRAVVATARKLAVLLHRLWRSNEPYDPNRKQSELAHMTRANNPNNATAPTSAPPLEVEAC